LKIKSSFVASFEVWCIASEQSFSGVLPWQFLPPLPFFFPSSQLGVTLFNVGYPLSFFQALPQPVVPLFFFTFGMTTVTPADTLLVTDLFPRNRSLMASY
jgi:hypothetical protein